MEIFDVEFKEEIKSQQCIQCLDIDIDIFEEYANIHQIEFESKEEKLGAILLDRLIKDVFFSLYKSSPKTRNEDEVLEPFKINLKILEDIKQTPYFDKLRELSVVNIFNSFAGVSILREDLESIFDKYCKELPNVEETLDVIEAHDEISAMIKDDIYSEEEINEKKEQLNEKMESYNETKENEPGNTAAPVLPITAPTIIRDVAKTVNDLDEVQKTLGEGLMAGTLLEKQTFCKEVINNKNFKRITDILGKFKIAARDSQKKSKTTEMGVAPRDITKGNDLARITQSEKINFANQKTKKDFKRRFYQKGLLQYELESKKTKNKGPIVCCLDRSGSMAGSRYDWAKSIVLSMLEIANIQKREVSIVAYSSEVNFVIDTVRSEIKPADLKKLLNNCASGGTDFEKVLEKSLEKITESTFKNADILFLTDGESRLSNDFTVKFNREKKDLEFSVLSIQIEDNSRASIETLNKFSDFVIHLDDLNTSSEKLNDIYKYF